MPVPRKKHAIAIVALGVIVISAVTAGRGLFTHTSGTSAQLPRPRLVTTAEAQRLAGVRLADYRMGHAGVHATIGTGANTIHMTGWVDWRAPLIYLNSIGTRPSGSDGMIQAIPGVVAIRSGRYAPATTAPGTPMANSPYPAPPLSAPATGWQVRPVQAGSVVDTTLSLLFALRAATADSAAQIAAIGTRYVTASEIAGVDVDVLDGAAIPPAPEPAAPTTPGASKKPAAPTKPAASEQPAGASSFAAYGGQVRYWVDAQSRLLRVEALASPTTPLRIDFDRTDPAIPSAIELLGGAPIHPRTLTASQTKLLSHMRMTDYTAATGAITVALPLSATQLVSAAGWLDWRDAALYLRIRDNRGTSAGALLRADIGGLTIHGTLAGTGGTTTTAPEPLTVPPPVAPRTGWTRSTWMSRSDQYGEPDLDLILNELLALAAPGTDDLTSLVKRASYLRADTVDGVRVGVFEIRQPAEGSIKPGQGRLRYWVDAHGLLRRLEVRGRAGAYGYVTVTPSPIPALPDPIPLTGNAAARTR